MAIYTTLLMGLLSLLVLELYWIICEKIQNIVIFYKYFPLFFLLTKLENYFYMQFKALFKSFKMNT